MEAFIFIIRTVANLYIAILLLRLLFQLVRADFYNPISQTIVKLTSPLVVPLRRMIPAIGRIDTASLVLAYLFQVVLAYVILLLQGYDASVISLLWWALLNLVHLSLDIFTFALFIVVILSWVDPYNRNPIALLAYQLTEPLLKPVRGKIPPVGGLDFSVMVVMLFLYVLGTFIIPVAPV